MGRSSSPIKTETTRISFIAPLKRVWLVIMGLRSQVVFVEIFCCPTWMMDNFWCWEVGFFLLFVSYDAVCWFWEQ